MQYHHCHVESYYSAYYKIAYCFEKAVLQNCVCYVDFFREPVVLYKPVYVTVEKAAEKSQKTSVPEGNKDVSTTTAHTNRNN